MKIIGTLLIAFAISISVSAQQKINTAELDRVFDSLAIRNKTMGSVLMTHKGVKVYERAIGYAVIDSVRQVKATPATRYRIGSITKTFTATMIMQLVEEQKLALNAHLNKHFPGIPNADQITIEMMLRHRSGIHNFTNDDAYWKSMTEPKTRSEMVAIFAKHQPDFKPDSQAVYSNTNYVLLGYILEDITGKSYEQNLQERILSRIGLKDTRFGGKADQAQGDAYSYIYSKSWDKQAETDLSQPAGAGAIVSTPGDIATFIQALFDGKLVSTESLQQMTKIVGLFGIGLVNTPFYEHAGFGHTGGLDGFQSVVAYFPGDSLAAVICSNGVDYPINDQLIAMLSTFYKLPLKIPDFKVFETPEEMDKYTGTYSSQQLPVKVTISRKDINLLAQVTGQPPFRLTPVKKGVFKFDAVGLTMEFKPSDNAITMTQGEDVYQFVK